jgi:hypothetical protein
MKYLALVFIAILSMSCSLMEQGQDYFLSGLMKLQLAKVYDKAMLEQIHFKMVDSTYNGKGAYYDTITKVIVLKRGYDNIFILGHEIGHYYQYNRLGYNYSHSDNYTVPLILNSKLGVEQEANVLGYLVCVLNDYTMPTPDKVYNSKDIMPLATYVCKYMGFDMDKLDQ